jgi:uncharacterized protein (DUF983 family)
MNNTELTEEERNYIRQALCPDCKTGKLLCGPRGGLSINVECDSCKHRFNVCEPIMSERI